ncbi:MAG: helix-turn-helix domain-containing protein [Alphaproteobacteria bacterium]
MPRAPSKSKPPKQKRVSLGPGLRRRGDELGLSQAEVARQVGISPERYGQYVRDEREPDFDTLDEICRVLKTTPDALLGYAADTASYGPRVREIAKRVSGLSEKHLDAVFGILDAFEDSDPPEQPDPPSEPPLPAPSKQKRRQRAGTGG